MDPVVLDPVEPGMRLKTMKRMLIFMAFNRPVTAVEINAALQLGSTANVTKWVRAFKELGIAEELHSIPNGKTSGPWIKRYQRTVRLVEGAGVK